MTKNWLEFRLAKIKKNSYNTANKLLLCNNFYKERKTESPDESGLNYNFMVVIYFLPKAASSNIDVVNDLGLSSG